MVLERRVKLVWLEDGGNGQDETHVTHGLLIGEDQDHFTIRLPDERQLYIAKRAVLKMIDEGGPRQ
jgi:hypothetical protein